MLLLEVTNARVPYQDGNMTRAAAGLGMGLDEFESGQGMIEACGIEPHHLELAVEMVLVAFRAIFLRNGGMVTAILLNSLLQRPVAGKTEIAARASLTQFVAGRAVLHAF